MTYLAVSSTAVYMVFWFFDKLVDLLKAFQCILIFPLFSTCSTEGAHTRLAAGAGDNNSDEAANQADLYKLVQQGGDIPIRGLQKPGPDKSGSTFIQHFILKVHTPPFYLYLVEKITIFIF